MKTWVSVPDTCEEMKIMIGNIALKDLFTTPSPAYQIIKKHFDGKYGTCKALNNKQVISRVKNTLKRNVPPLKKLALSNLFANLGVGTCMQKCLR